MIAILYNYSNHIKMENELSSIKFQMIENIELVKYDSNIENYEIIIVDSSFYYKFINNKIILIVSSIDDYIYQNENIILVQYESKTIKESIEKRNLWLKDIQSVIINCIPKQKLEINPIDTQDSTIYFHGEDKPENMVDEMFELDSNIHYEIQFYDKIIKEEPSLKHRLSWNVTTDENLNGIIQYKIIREIENGSLPILLKETMPKYFFAYPFVITNEELKNKELLIDKVKLISSYIGKMSKAEFKMLANSIYNSIYINTNWKIEFYKLCKTIKECE